MRHTLCSRSIVPLLCAASFFSACDSSPSRPAAGDSAALFGDNRVWTLHRVVQPDQLAAMPPKQAAARAGGLKRFLGKLGRRLRPPGPDGSRDRDSSDRGPSESLEFTYSEADLTFDGQDFRRVGLRYKGNSSYRESAGTLKRPLKIDFDRFVKGQHRQGITKLNFSNNVLDPSQKREVLAYGLLREAGIVAPRTAHAKIYLTVPGRYDRVYLGRYTMVEQVDKKFLSSRFGTTKGLLLKPSRLRGINFRGEDWAAYVDRYNPKSGVTDVGIRRLMAFARFVETSNDTEFSASIGTWMDLRAFARFLAANVLLANLDSFLGMSRNYYLYLHPESQRFLWIPWDLDLAFGLHRMLGSMEDQMRLSLRTPYVGRNNLLERLLALDSFTELYRAQVVELSTTIFAVERIRRRIAAIDRTLAPLLAEEPGRGRGPRHASFGIGLPSVALPFLPIAVLLPSPRWAPIPLEEFIAGRMQSVAAQLAGKSAGTVLR